ncbi:type IV secretion system protein VirB5 [Bartonella taylorii]|uniref:VirB5 n=12 Tax=unclassified Bartonella TaxID=2645622 RepID=K9MWI0_9HYPH|nr:type IV secretion system protein VirB5 [Bartonella taylorii]AFY07834.1 VirB5 [Bartonella sp. A70]AFY07835.1 VirB5 [Bartonella sp. A132]AFY07836.1 VirB5 [Bartonella sp. A145]AFY07837.1 VirB5 [Bartonella sp. A190]AFY07838.1 VirB5 [Bartonella sp. A193]AFY07839.1 VirB5 [Bartonella sp. A201]AFY07841.1 VirB5 [Bartonella sp. A614]AFY07842.1 VirB5 [Bartonella sp. A444]AFY07843.1 VirB5 [Bartonella sp. A475]AFY07844.1 VirB5 [Bartonella sp. A468]AFY07845.1 VirB5 [Bartonella sp. A419]AFY07846.1 
MKKYGLATLLSLSFISHAMSQTALNVDEYYKNALENTQKLNTAKSETAESVYETAVETAKKIEEIRQKLEDAKLKKEDKVEEFQDLRAQLSLLQANLQVSSLKLQSLSMIQANDTSTKEEIREEEAQKKHQELAEEIKKKLGKSNVRL